MAKPKRLIDKNKKITHPYMIQRIVKKSPKNRPAFGAGGERAYLSKSAFDELRKFCGFGYMGSAQFETNALPDAFDRMQKAHKNNDILVIQEVVVSGNLPVWVVANGSLIGEAIIAVQSLRIKESTTRDSTHFDLIKKDNGDFETQGWIDVGHQNYMFFVNEKMAKNYHKFVTTFDKPFTDPKHKRRIPRRTEKTMNDLLAADHKKFSSMLTNLLKEELYDIDEMDQLYLQAAKSRGW